MITIVVLEIFFSLKGVCGNKIIYNFLLLLLFFLKQFYISCIIYTI